jgi:hypothetical protein
MSILARNRHPTGRGGKVLEETFREYSFFAPVCGNNICTLSHGVVFHNPIMEEWTTIRARSTSDSITLRPFE